MIAWSPAIAAFLWFLPIAARGALEDVPVEGLLFSLFSLAVFVAGALWTVINPRQGLPDRIAGTSLVAR